MSTPFSWDELESIVPDVLTIATVPPRVSRDGDPWLPMSAAPQSLEPVLVLHERDTAAGLPRRAVAAAVSEDAGGAVSGRPEPRPQARNALLSERGSAGAPPTKTRLVAGYDPEPRHWARR